MSEAKRMCFCLLAVLTFGGVCMGQDAETGISGLYTNLQWRIAEGCARWVKIVDGVLVVDVPSGESNVFAFAKAAIDLRSVDRAALEIALRARSFGITASGPGRGMKVALHYVDGNSGMKKYPYNRNIGTKAFDWKSISLFVPIGEVPPSPDPAPEIVLGIQQATGHVEFDLRSVLVRKAKTYSAAPDGNRVVGYPDRMKRNPLMRGVMSPGGFRTTEKDIEDLHCFGARLVRVQMNSFVQKNESVASKTLEQWNVWFAKWLPHIDDILGWAEKRNMQIVIDMHAPPVGSYGDRCTTFQNAEHADRFVQAWEELALRYRNRKGVYGYDLMNEPAQCERAVPNCDYWNIQRRAAEAIRAVDPDATIIIEANEWDGPWAFSYLCALDMDNVVYQVHMYAPAGYTHQGCRAEADPAVERLWHYPSNAPGKSLSRADLRRTMLPVLDFQRRHRCRILVGEFSASAFAPGAAEYVSDCIDMFEEYGWDWTYHSFREARPWDVERTPESGSGDSRNVDNPRYFVLTRAFRDSLHVEMRQRDIVLTENCRLGKCETTLGVGGDKRVAFSALASVSFEDGDPIGDAVGMSVSCLDARGETLSLESVAFCDYIEMGHRYRAFDEVLNIPAGSTRAVLSFSARNRVGEVRFSGVRATPTGGASCQ